MRRPEDRDSASTYGTHSAEAASQWSLVRTSKRLLWAGMLATAVAAVENRLWEQGRKQGPGVLIKQKMPSWCSKCI